MIYPHSFYIIRRWRKHRSAPFFSKAEADTFPIDQNAFPRQLGVTLSRFEAAVDEKGMANKLEQYVGKAVKIVLPVYPDEEMTEACDGNLPLDESIWAEVSRVERGRLIGYLVNAPVFASGMYGDEVNFREEDIVDIWRME